MKRRLVVLFIACLMTSFPAHGQQNVGSVTGTVRDPSGAVVPGVSVVARDSATGTETKTVSNELGTYTFPRLDIGTYTLSASLASFKTVETTSVRVIAGHSSTVDIQLQLGQTTQVVEVTGAPPVIDTKTTTKGTTRVLEEIGELPLQLNGTPRNSMQFMRTLSGVGIDLGSPDIIQTERAVVDGVGDGSPYKSWTSYNIDGVSASGNMGQQLRDDSGPIPETVEEFRVSTNLNAEYGWSKGTALELVTKSGSNSFHGSVFEYLRNDALDSRNFFAKTVSPYKQNEFGGVLGGPIVKNKLFFLGSYDGYRLASASAGSTATVPTAKMRSGDFSEWLGPQIGTDVLGRPVYQGQIYDPATTRPDGKGGFIRDPFANNIIPTNKLSSLSQAFQAGYPNPTRSGIANNWVGLNAPSPLVIDKYTVKVDGQWGQNKISVGWQKLQRDKQTFGGIFDPTIANTYLVAAYQYHFQINYLRTLRPNLLLGFRTGITRNPRDIGQYGLPSADFGAKAGLKGTFSPETPSVGIADVTGFGGPFRRISDPSSTVPILLDLTLLKSRHNLKFGAGYEHVAAQKVLEIIGSGSYSFPKAETGLPAFPGSTGVGYASYLLGTVDSASMLKFAADKNSGVNWGFYAQDDWRVTNKLTVNYGLRWDFYVPTHETYFRNSSFDPSIPNPGAGGLLGALSFYGTGPGRNGRQRLLDYYYRNWGPRLGISYAWNPKTVTRAYYGIVYVPIVSDIVNATQIPSDGWSATLVQVSPNGGVTPAFNWTSGWPTPLPNLPILDPTLDNGGSIQYISPSLDRRTPMSQNLGLGLERELPANISVKAEYVGKLTHRESMSVPLNYLDPKYLSLGFLLAANINSPQAVAAGFKKPYPGFNGSVQQSLYAYPQYPGGVTQVDSKSLNTFYHSFQLNVQKRFGQGLTMLLAYTISKNLYSAIGVSPAYPRIKVFQGLDRPQMLNLSYIYNLPFGPGKHYLGGANGALRQLVSGWAIIGSHNYMAGQPVGVSQSNYTGQPIRTSVGCSNYDPNNPASRYLNISAFQIPAPFTFGNTTGQLSTVRTCGYMNENISIRKRFPVRESLNIDFAGEFFNMFNRHAWRGLNGSVSNPAAFGRYSSATDPRTIQFHLKVNF